MWGIVSEQLRWLREADKWITEATKVLLYRCGETSKCENECEKLKQEPMSLSDYLSWRCDVP